jgi:hypothetical protein
VSAGSDIGDNVEAVMKATVECAGDGSKVQLAISGAPGAAVGQLKFGKPI